ncbi:ATP-binding protein [Methanosphaerula subterraneus]|uniref:ATP-binding protein n=1 Tax=Methanosphaerula subterraneus TaxID=3350244 RepID=UPI003F84521B
MTTSIKTRERTAIIQSLSAGVVPRIGLRHIQVGRAEEIKAVLTDISKIKDESASIRFIIGKYGSGKSFFLNLSRIVALEQKLVVTQADITPDRRLHASNGQARQLYAELMHNMSTKAKPDGGAMVSVVEKWISDLDFTLREEGKDQADITKSIYSQLKPLQDLVSGYDFATVVAKYYEGYFSQNEILQGCAIRWLSGEYITKTEAYHDLGVRTIINDSTIYDYLKLWGSFVRMAGYNGLLVNIDEMGVLSHRLNSSQARNSNYEMILRILNDSLQGNVKSIGFMFAGIDEFLLDRRRGLMSYDALARRLSENEFAREGRKDFSGPVIRLDNLTPEDTYILLHNVRNVFASGDPTKNLIPDEGITGFMTFCAQTLGSEFYMTPGDVVKKFVGFLSVIEQNPDSSWQEILNILPGDSKKESNVSDSPINISNDDNDELVSFKL